jgi:hypothetical protein
MAVWFPVDIPMVNDFGPQKWGILPRFPYRLWELLLFDITL